MSEGKNALRDAAIAAAGEISDIFEGPIEGYTLTLVVETIERAIVGYAAMSDIKPGDVVVLAGGKRSEDLPWTVVWIDEGHTGTWANIERDRGPVMGVQTHRIRVEALRKVESELHPTHVSALDELARLQAFIDAQLPGQQQADECLVDTAIRLLGERMDEETHDAIKDAVNLVLCSTPQKFPDHTMRVLRRWLDEQGVV